jgi:hypothetical protein
MLATILAAGLTVAWAVVAAWALSMGQYVAVPARAAERLIVLPEGTALVEQENSRHGARQYRDLDGSPVPAPQADNARWLRGTPLPADLPAPTAIANVNWSKRLHSFADGRSPAGFWYFVSDGRPEAEGYFVCYDSQSRARVGYLGTAGFRDDMPPTDERFPFGGGTAARQMRLIGMTLARLPTDHPGENEAGQAPRGSLSTWDVYVLGRDGKVYHADLHNRTVEVILDEPGLRSAAVVPGVHDPQRGTPHYLAVRTDNAVLVLDERGKLRKRWPIPEALRGQEFTYAETAAGEAVLHWHSPDDSLAATAEHRVYRVAADGRWREAGTTLAHAGGMPAFPVLGGVVFPAPAVLFGYVGLQRGGELVDKGLVATYPEALARALAEFWPALAIAQALALALAVLTYHRQVRYAAGGAERVLWPLFVLVLGLPGWVGYRFGRSWPVLEPCPACGADSPRDREDCASCEVEYPRPALKGTEVFA